MENHPEALLTTETRTCCVCQADKPATSDFFYKTGKNGKYLSGKCKECFPSGAANRRKRKQEGRSTPADLRHQMRLQTQLQKRQEIRLKIVDIKLTRGCIDCGYDAHPDALDFDHLPGADKKFDLSRCNHKTWEDISNEIAKCEVVCANCHRIRTQKRRDYAAVVTPS